VQEYAGTLDGAGIADFAVTLTDTATNGGLNHFVAVLEDPSAVAPDASLRTSAASATLILELRDSETARPLARYLQRRELGGGLADGGSGASLRRLERVVDRSIREMGNELQTLAPPSQREWEGGCRGGFTRAALGAR